MKVELIEEYKAQLPQTLPILPFRDPFSSRLKWAGSTLGSCL